MTHRTIATGATIADRDTAGHIRPGDRVRIWRSGVAVEAHVVDARPHRLVVAEEVVAP